MLLVAYGSLMDKKKVKDKNCKLVIVKGRKRIFNKVASRKVWKKHAKGKEIATLNVVKDKNSSFNAVILDIDDDRLEKLKGKEQDYHLEKALAYDYKTNKKLGQFCIFASNKRNSKNKIIIKNNIMPIKKYMQACRKAAYSWGKRFGNDFDKTTYLSDNRTTIKKFLG